MTPNEFIAKWLRSKLNERSAAQEHFIDLCGLLDEPTPAEVDPTGDRYCFERGVRKDIGGEGWADVWKRHCFAWEYKRKKANLDEAFKQLRQYALALENPPLLIVSDMFRFRIHTNWTNSVSKVHEFTLDDLQNASTREMLKWAMSDPERLRPDVTRKMLTERVAASFGSLAQSLRDRGHNPRTVARFVNRLVFCMFAEDGGLLPEKMFTRMLEQARSRPAEFVELAQDLFRAMSTGGRIGFEAVSWFNGGLFDDDIALPLDTNDIELALGAASLDWSEIDPSIFGTLFERGLDPDKGSQLGAHYTDRDKIMQIIEPVIVKPLIAEWTARKDELATLLIKAETAKSEGARTHQWRRAGYLLASFLERLRQFTVLDPACGSGNFLYLALHALKDFEHLVQLEAEALGLHRSFPAIGPANVLGIEVNPFAAELARVSVWIGEIQWSRRNGFNVSDNPILKPLDTIECRDAILTADRSEPEWPRADVIVGNPPFLGGKKLKKYLGEQYVADLFRTYRGRVPQEADLVCYWVVKAGEQLTAGKTKRIGLVTTNSIRDGANRQALESSIGTHRIFEAWSDEPWVIEGAAVRVSLVCISRRDDASVEDTRLDGEPVDAIHTDLSGRRGDAGVDLTLAGKLRSNLGVAFMGNTKGGDFVISGEQARSWLREPANPNGRTNSDVLKPWANGDDVTQRSKDGWIVDFGRQIVEEEAALYERPYHFIRAHVYDKRQDNSEEKHRLYWWRHLRPRPKMSTALEKLSRCIVTPATAKHRLFTWLDTRICPDHALIVIARDDDTTFGILHSRFPRGLGIAKGIESRRPSAIHAHDHL